MRNLTERQFTNFFAKINDTTDCWLWNAALNEHGYGLFYFNGKMVKAHRLSYELFYNTIIPDDLQPDHTCRVRDCICPTHLEVVTKKENILRGECPTAKNARKTHCSRGHLFDDQNTLVRRSGRRACRICRRDRQFQKYHEKNLDS